MKEREERSREVSAKRVGLVSPVEAVWSSCVLVEVVLSLVVVFEDLYKVSLCKSSLGCDEEEEVEIDMVIMEVGIKVLVLVVRNLSVEVVEGKKWQK